MKKTSLQRAVSKSLLILAQLALLVGIMWSVPSLAHASSVPKILPKHIASETFVQASLQTFGSPGWTNFTDDLGNAAAFTSTNGSTRTAQATWDFSSTSCQIFVYVPSGHATGSVGYGLFSGSTRTRVVSINQNPVQGFQFLANGTNTTRVQMSNNTGATGTQIGVGTNVGDSLEIIC